MSQYIVYVPYVYEPPPDFWKKWAPQPNEEDRLAALIHRETTRSFGRPRHHKHCVDVHCTPHAVLAGNTDILVTTFCLTEGFYKSSKWPHTLFCRACIDKLASRRDVGTVTVHEL